MKTRFLLFIITLSLGVSDVFSQNIQGIATYKSQKKGICPNGDPRQANKGYYFGQNSMMNLNTSKR